MSDYLSTVLIQCTYAARSGAGKYVSGLVGSLLLYAPNIRLVCPEDSEYLKSLPKESVSCFLSLGAKGDGQSRASKVVAMVRQCVASTRAILDLGGRQRNCRALVHFNFAGLSFLALPQIALLKLCRFRVVLTVHDVLPHRWLLPRWIRWFERIVLNLLYRIADMLVVHHSSQQLLLVEQFGISRRRISVVPLGAISLGDEALPYKATEYFEVLCFGAIREGKGIHLAINAVQRLRAQGAPVRLTIAGAVSLGERAYWTSCTDIISLAPGGIDVCEGFIAEHAVSEFFERAHIVLLPYTRFYSQSGVATMACASGRAIVSTEVGGLAELVSSDHFGFAIREPSVEGVMTALKRAISGGHDDLQHIGISAFEEAKRRFSWDKVARIHLSIYAESLGLSPEALSEAPEATSVCRVVDNAPS